MLAAFHLNLTALSWVALVVGLFLVYNTVTISVIARRDEIGMLRALGVTRRQVLGAVPGRGGCCSAWPARCSASGSGGCWPTARSASPAPPSARSTSPPRRRRRRSAARHVALAVRGRPAAVAAGRRCCRRSRRRGCRPRPRCAAPTGSNRACACGPRRWPSPPLVLAGAVGLAQLGPGRRPAALRLRRGVRDHHRRVAAGAGHHLRRWPARSAARCAAARRRGPARARQPRRGDPAPVDLGGRAGRQPVDDGRGGGDDRQLPRHGRLLGRPDAAGRPLRRPGVQPTAGSSQTLSPDVIDAVRGHPDVEAVDTFRNVDLVYSGNLVVLGAGNFDVVLSHGSLLFKAPADGRAALRAAPSAPTRWSSPRRSPTATPPAPATRSRCRRRRATGRSAVAASTTTTPSTAA